MKQDKVIIIMCTILVVKSIYEYNESKDPSILVFEADERFVLIKDPDHDTDWYYVINHKGQIGYVPHSYVAFEEVSFCLRLFIINFLIHLNF